MWKRLPFLMPLAGALLLLLAPSRPALSSAPRAVAPPAERPERAAPREEGCRVCAAARRLGVRMAPLRRTTRYRCPHGGFLARATLPRGRLRPTDLSTLRFEVDIAAGGAQGEAFLDRFQRDPHVVMRWPGGGRARIPLASPARLRMHADVPDTLQAALRGIRGAITWGRGDQPDAQGTVRVWLDPPSARERARLALVRRLLADGPRWIRELVEAQVLLDFAFDHAALRLAQAVRAGRPQEPHAAAIEHAAWTYLGLAYAREALDLDARVVLPALRAPRPHRCMLRPDRVPRIRARAALPPQAGCGPP